MKYLTTEEIRNIWIEFWMKKNHINIKSKSLIPYEDPSLLFINSGVSTIKKYFSGEEIPPSNKIVNIQKSLRTNDIENVGLTSRHHTLFEMMGNFSIGDYFKKESITWAWELLTDSKYYALDSQKLYVTIHPKDNETLEIWKNIGVSEEHIIKTEENFWEIGKGPGGPNTEIFFDRGIEFDSRDVSELLEKDLDNDRIIEIWNIVFSQYNCDPSKPQSEYEELPQKNIDTGMGLERMACVLQEVETNFETDTFKNILLEIEKLTDTKYVDNKKAYRIISDHVRALTFAISDKVIPSNEGRGYVIRRILRRAVKYGYLDLQMNENLFLYKLVPSVVQTMNSFYPELKTNEQNIIEVIKREEKQFLLTLKSGMKHFDKESEKLKIGEKLSGDKLFKLYDTYGFPLELTIELAKEKGLTYNIEDFNQELGEQKKRAKNARKDISSIGVQNDFLKNINIQSEFIGYDILETEAKILFMTDGEKELQNLKAGESGFLIFDKTPFYATSGGQKCDVGKTNSFEILEVIKTPQGQHLHKVKVSEEISKNQEIHLEINRDVRIATSKNHSATHLLHFALEKVLGNGVEQAGSLQDNEKTRFDYTTYSSPTKQQLQEIQTIVNSEIQKESPVTTKTMSLNEAKKIGAKALFSDKYGEEVRVVIMNESIELCGGTHVQNTSEIENFLIVSEQSIGSGTRRIEALTSENIRQYSKNIINELKKSEIVFEKDIQNKKNINTESYEKNLEKLLQVNNVLKLALTDYQNCLTKYKEHNLELKNDMQASGEQLIKEILENSQNSVKEENGIKKIELEIKNFEKSNLKILSDKLLEQISSGIVIIKCRNDSNLNVVVKISEDLTDKYNAAKIIKEILDPLDGRGGGKPSFAQGGAVIS